jgi:hypothetical protein
VLLASEEAPLKLKIISIDRSNLFKLLECGLDLLGCDEKKRIICNLEAILEWAIERHFNNHLQIKLVLKLDEELA